MVRNDLRKYEGELSFARFFSPEYRIDTVYKKQSNLIPHSLPTVRAPSADFFLLTNLFLFPPRFVLHMHNLMLILMRNMSAMIWQVIYKQHKILQNFGGIKQTNCY